MTDGAAAASADAATWTRRAQIAAALGYAVRRLPDVDVLGRAVPRYEVDAGTNERAIRLFQAFAEDDARHDEGVRAIASAMREWADRLPAGMDREVELAHKIQRFVRDNVRFQREEEEATMASSLTLSLGQGDCDDHTVLVVALCLAAGLPARIETVRNARGQIIHAVPMALVNGKRTWLETTINARFGEHPIDAAKRLGVLRRDITG